MGGVIPVRFEKFLSYISAYLTIIHNSILLNKIRIIKIRNREFQHDPDKLNGFLRNQISVFQVLDSEGAEPSNINPRKL